MKYFAAILLVTVFSMQAEAKRAYSVAGCGLGNQVFGKENQVLAATTNGTSANQMFGITSGTSNCLDGSGSTAQNQMPVFIESNKLSLANDIARGQGETLTSLTSIMGCEQTDLVGTTLQKNYERIFTSENLNGADISDSILGVVKGDALLASDCKQVI